MKADQIVKALEAEVFCESCPHNGSECLEGGCFYVNAASLIEELTSQLSASQQETKAFEAATRRHYNDTTSQCFICYSCINHDARERAHWDGKKLEGFACTGCGKGKPKWQFDIGRFSPQKHKEE